MLRSTDEIYFLIFVTEYMLAGYATTPFCTGEDPLSVADRQDEIINMLKKTAATKKRGLGLNKIIFLLPILCRILFYPWLDNFTRKITLK